MFIVLEGIDGSGKTTLSENLTHSLNTIETKAVRFSEPTYFETGLFIRKFLKGEISLSPEEQIEAFLNDREISVVKNILPNLKSNLIVVLDRYYYSTSAYQASKDYSPIDILNLNINRNFPKPDLLFFIDINPNEAFHRISQRGSTKEIFESIEHLTKIYKNFRDVLPKETLYLNGMLSEIALVNQCLMYIEEYKNSYIVTL
jgi:dTMP kinase